MRGGSKRKATKSEGRDQRSCELHIGCDFGSDSGLALVLALALARAVAVAVAVAVDVDVLLYLVARGCNYNYGMLLYLWHLNATR